ncbi:ABC transporter ATP-binding protein [Vagococcus silagei]|uniref:ABC transporter ATP-binding protein n=1 Tax=Vagococcus silagei TaxID=2508885 RepID=A0A4S3B1L3_9ENTE|nr:ABC transporter ATP-binding protein [Vagococcus silagei]THB60328.1 ABC transporter ATP-binding protein [Vagococcus silagei]
MENYLTLSHLEKNYGTKEVIHHLSLSVAKGEIYVLLGKNGAGKSTLFKLIAELALPTNGTISIGGHPITQQTRKKIGMSINQPVFYEDLTAEDNLRIHCTYMDYPLSTSHLSDTLKLVGLAPENQTSVKNFSLGMRQRLMLARCLIHEPNLLVIDEPLNGLDPNAIRQMRILLKNLAASGLAILMSSHILSEVEAVATTIGVMNHGVLRFSAPLTSLQQQYGEQLEDYLIQEMEGDPLNETYQIRN